jgi:ribosomal protein S18 acetylase RimI-like enzyme
MPGPVLDATSAPVDDDEIEQLLRRVYVDGGFTSPDLAETLFAAAAVRARGRILFVREGQALAGMIIVVPPTSPARRLAAAGEMELHLLAVAPEQRHAGVGGALVGAALDSARAAGFASVVLWTQPTMHAAQRLYEQCGFVRAPERDFERSERSFRVYAINL